MSKAPVSKKSPAPTRENIYLTAVRMFAERGYSAVSVRDIAESVGITAAAIYNHFKNKEEILEEVINSTNKMISDYYERLDKSTEESSSFEEVMDCVFAELEKVRDITVYFGVATLTSEQFQNKKAGIALDEVYIKRGIEFTATIFSRCINKGWAKPFDTIACATLITNSVLAGTLARVRNELGQTSAYDPSEMFTSVKHFLYNAVTER